MSLPAGFASYGVVGGKLYSREDVLNYLMSQGDSDEEDEYELEEDELQEEEAGKGKGAGDERSKPLEAEDEDRFKAYIKRTELEYGTGHYTVAVLYTMLGELQLKIGKLDEAEQAFKTSFDIHKNRTFNPSQEYDCATVREHLAQVAEARGDLKGAKKMRLSCGKEKLRCANINHSGKSDFLKLNNFSQCKHCKSVYYCSVGCQKVDWAARHKTLCSYVSSSKTNSSAV